MVWTCKEYARKQTATEHFYNENQWEREEGDDPKRDGVRRNTTNHGLTEEDTRDRDRWRNLVLGEGRPL
jgi:hypothetical protein